MRRNITKLFVLLVAASLILAVNPYFTLAWDQAPDYQTHQEINNQALLRFFSEYGSGTKYKNSTINETTSFWGSDIVSNSLLQSGIEVKRVRQTFKDWLKSGGHSADEPHLWASVRHFYDPLANHAHELTDHYNVWHHELGYSAISAKDWALDYPTNPFCWKKALLYYKNAMEIPEDSLISVIKGSDFRDPDLPVSSPAEARDTYLGKAYRSLGETMHMFADMTQPCHVRNDSHPTGDLDPLESYATHDHVTAYAGYPVDPRSGIDGAGNTEALFESLAHFTNEHFYTYDTIYDNATGIGPRNMEQPMPHPQFNELKPGIAIGNRVKTYSGNFNGKPVPLVQLSYCTNIFRLTPELQYIVPTAFSDNLSQVLLPIAVEADAKLINFLFPTMELTINVSELKDVEKGSDISYKEYLVDGKMEQQIKDDPEWAWNGLQIEYSGPVELWCNRKGKALHIGDTKFKSGSIDEILHVYTGDAPRQTNAEKIKEYQVENEDNLYFVIKAGGRTFVSKPYKFAAEPQISIDPSKLDGHSGTEYNFTGKVVNPPIKPRYDWYVDGKKVQSGPKTSFITKFPAANRYEVSVQCLDETGKVLCDDSLTANIIKDKDKDTVCKTPPPADVLAKLQKTTNFKCQLVDVPCTVQASGSWNKWAPGYVKTLTLEVPADVKHLEWESAAHIKWSGTSFSSAGMAKGSPDKLTGNVCYSGNKVLISFDYEIKDDDPRNIYKVSVKDVPLNDPQDGGEKLSYRSVRPGLWQYHRTGNYQGTGLLTRLEWAGHDEQRLGDLTQVWDYKMTEWHWDDHIGPELFLYE